LRSRDLAQVDNLMSSILSTVLPDCIPIGLSKEFASDAIKNAQWNAFIRKVGTGNTPPPLSGVIERLHGVLFPVLEAVRNIV
ncbi:MAG: hypothetical protein WCK17_15080, partial [Verrucomicrobiota bacterium]